MFMNRHRLISFLFVCFLGTSSAMSLFAIDDVYYWAGKKKNTDTDADRQARVIERNASDEKASADAKKAVETATANDNREYVPLDNGGRMYILNDDKNMTADPARPDTVRAVIVR